MTCSIPALHLPAGPFVPARDFPEVEHSPHWKNLSPRVGVAYDLFGNGKTALKVSLGRYSQRNTGVAVNIPVTNQATSATRTLERRQRELRPRLRSQRTPAVNGECGAWGDLTFGQVRAGNTRYADDALAASTSETYNWQSSVSVQHAAAAEGMALNVGYFRTWYGDFLATDNQLVTPADYDPYCITVPTDTRLPSSGQQLCGLYDINAGAVRPGQQPA